MPAIIRKKFMAMKEAKKRELRAGFFAAPVARAAVPKIETETEYRSLIPGKKPPTLDQIRGYTKLKQGSAKSFSPIGYAAWTCQTGAGLCEDVGARDRQEDRAGIAKCPPGFKELTEEKQAEVLKTVFAKQAQLIKEFKLPGGATGVAAIHDRNNKIHWVSLGDGTIHAVRLGEENKVLSAEQLNTQFNLENENEKNRIKGIAEIKRKTGQKILVVSKEGALRLVNNDLTAGINLTAGFGHEEYEEKGFRSTPESGIFDFKEAPGERRFLVLACDGLTEGNDMTRMTQENIGQYLSEFLTTYPKSANQTDLMAQHLLEKAIFDDKHKVGDNVSVIVIDLDQCKEMGLSYIFDGHISKKDLRALQKANKPEIVDLLKDSFEPAVAKQIQLQLEIEKKAEAKLEEKRSAFPTRRA